MDMLIILIKLKLKFHNQNTLGTVNSVYISNCYSTLGPIRAPTNVRSTCRFDFNPSLCKDYHVSG